MGSKELEDLHHEIKNRPSCLKGCLWFVLIVGIVSIIAILWIVSRVGAVTIPGISSITYRQPTPHETVVVDDAILDTVAQKLVTTDAAKGKETTLSLTQEELTALLRQKMPEATITIHDGILEWFGPVTAKGCTVYTTVQVLPLAIDRKLHIEVRELKVGNIRLPRPLVVIASDQIQKQVIEKNALDKQFDVSEITLNDTSITVRAKIPPGALDSL